MTEYETPEEPEASAVDEVEQAAEDVWNDVVASLDELGNAVGAWARAVTDDPRNRRRARQLKDGLESVGRQIGDVVDNATRTDIGSQVGSAAAKAGDIMLDTARRVGDEVAPRLAGAFRSAAEGLRQTAERMERRATGTSPTTGEGAVEPETPPGPSPQQAPYTGEEPPGPAPSGVAESDYVP